MNIETKYNYFSPFIVKYILPTYISVKKFDYFELIKIILNISRELHSDSLTQMIGWNSVSTPIIQSKNLTLRECFTSKSLVRT